MRHAIVLPLIVLLLPFLGGCTTTDNPDNDGEKKPDNGSSIATEGDLKRQKIRVLELLETFEGKDVQVMQASCKELREMSTEGTDAGKGASLVSEEILECAKRFQEPITRNAAHERLRWISKLARTMLLLELDKDETTEREEWKRCRDTVVRMGPEATVRMTGVLIIKFTNAPQWCRGMLMDLCVSQGDVVIDAIFEAINFDEKPGEGTMAVRLLDDNTRQGLVQAILFLPEAPVAKIRQSASHGPQSARRAWAKLLARRVTDDKARPATEGWAVDILIEQLQGDSSWQIRAEAAGSLGDANLAQKVVPILILALKDKDPYVRSNVCKSLVIYGSAGKDGVWAILDMLADVEAAHRAGDWRDELERNALKALQAITGKRFQSIETFKAWAEQAVPR